MSAKKKRKMSWWKNFSTVPLSRSSTSISVLILCKRGWTILTPVGGWRSRIPCPRRTIWKGSKRSRGGKRVAGLDELLSQVTREMRRLYERYQIQSGLNEVEQRLRSIVEQERQALEGEQDARPDLEAKKEFLDHLPSKPSEAIEKLASYTFEDAPWPQVCMEN